jgi:transcriptional regulator with XRE-family HTH domain
LLRFFFGRNRKNRKPDPQLPGLGVPQANIAFWERSEKPSRSEVLPKMAEALGVSVEDLLIVETGKAETQKSG